MPVCQVIIIAVIILFCIFIDKVVDKKFTTVCLLDDVMKRALNFKLLKDILKDVSLLLSTCTILG